MESSSDRNCRSVWNINVTPYAKSHFAVFPTELVLRCILAGCPQNGTVLEPFLDAGTTALVAQELGRNCVGVELNPQYLKLAAKHCQQTTNWGAMAGANTTVESR